MRRTEASQRGFTLVEMIVVMVITGILAGMVAVFLKTPVQAYVDSANRAQLTDAADLALRRMAREIRLALPNSVRVDASARALEFLPAITGGRYWAADDPVAGDFLSFTDPADLGFDVIGAMPGGRQQILAGYWLVVYNLGEGMAPGDAYDCSVACNRAAIADVSGQKITLASNPFAAQDPALASPTSRFQVISGPVSYVCTPGAGGTGQLVRYANYPISQLQGDPPAGPALSTAIVTKNVVACTFDYTQPAYGLANARSALVGLTLTLQMPGTTEVVTLSQQVHVDNTP
ncbi:MAG: type II secretion system protein [Telluria sp.]